MSKKANETSAQEIQIVTYKRRYELDLKDFSNAVINFTDENPQSLFEQVLMCKIFGIKYNLTDNTLSMDYYSKLSYNLMYATGNDVGDTKKCLFGIVSNFKATGAKIGSSNDTYDDLEIKGPYFFIFAHKDAVTGANPSDAKDILRVHKIVNCPNTHFVDAAANSKKCGLFAGPTGTDTDCIFGFFTAKIENVDTDVFYLPLWSYCLEGRTKNIITLPTDDYDGFFKINEPVSSVVSQS